jgi:hypothetical protein
MKTDCLIQQFGKARLLQHPNGKYELVGGGEGDYTDAKEWVSLFAHDIVFKRRIFRRSPTAVGRRFNPTSSSQGETSLWGFN